MWPRVRPLEFAMDAPHKSFSVLGISPALVRALKMLAIGVPTPIQGATIPAILEGRDVIGGAETGSGKTLAFALPILHGLIRDMVAGYAVVLTPTRELAVQLHEQFLAVGQGSQMGLQCALVVGGVDMLKQAVELASQRPHIIVATPGRLVDLLRSGGAQEWGLGRCRYLVLDEADRLLTPTFAQDLAYLFSVLPPARTRQTLLFTATLTPEIERLTLKEPEPGKLAPLLRKIERDASTPATLTQQYVFVPSHMREPYLVHLLHDPPTSRGTARGALAKQAQAVYRRRVEVPQEAAPGFPATIIFASRCRNAELVSRMLTELGIANVSLHSMLPQSVRFENLQAFRARRVPILVSTDVGSRGLDIPEVELIVNWDLPAAWEDYVHRVGRTARKGRRGWAVSFVTERDVDLLRSIEAKINKELEALELPEERVLERLADVTSARRVASMALQDEHFGEARERNAEKARRQGMRASGKGGKRAADKAGGAERAKEGGRGGRKKAKAGHAA
ncbi:RNA helicase [Malassezia sp. CBS 17886]|nr:RNA helicase [Malassezia sp. CBS 17886]